MEEIPCLESQDIHCLLWNPNVHYNVNKSLPLPPVLHFTNQVLKLTPFFSKSCLIITFPSTPRYSLVTSSIHIFLRLKYL